MPITNFLGFSTTAASNVDVNGISIQGSAAVSNFDNSFRELMAILRRDLDNGMVLTSKSANYTAVAADNNAVIRFSAAATLSLTAAATLGADWHVWVMADGGSVVIDPNSTETINGATTITIPDGRSTLVICDGTNFRAFEDYSVSDGTAAAPSYSFTSDPDTGAYRVGSNQYGISTGGTLRVTFDSTGLISTVPFDAPDGTAAAPSHTFTNDPDTGMYSAGANTLGFSTAGTVAMTLSSTIIQAATGVSIQVGSPSSAGASEGNAFGAALITSSKTGTSTQTHMRFVNGNGTVGSITTGGLNTAYNTTSDGRLKVNRSRLADEIDVGAIIDAIEPVAYDWLSGVTGEPTGERGHGFIAQDLHQIIPVAASPGNGDPGDDDFMPWGVDKSALVTYLWAELQSVRRRLAALEEK